jgi:hypothetical protein
MKFSITKVKGLYSVKYGSLNNKFRDSLLNKSWTYAVTFPPVKHLGVLQFRRLLKG